MREGWIEFLESETLINYAAIVDQSLLLRVFSELFSKTKCSFRLTIIRHIVASMKQWYKTLRNKREEAGNLMRILYGKIRKRGCRSSKRSRVKRTPCPALSSSKKFSIWKKEQPRNDLDLIQNYEGSDYLCSSNTTKKMCSKHYLYINKNRQCLVYFVLFYKNLNQMEIEHACKRKRPCGEKAIWISFEIFLNIS